MGDLTCTERVDGRCLLVGAPAADTMCAHCLADATGLFRAQLRAGKARRDLRARAGEKWPCERFSLEVDATFCAECRVNPALKQMLASARGQVARRTIPCIHRGEQRGELEVKCCGGKTKLVPVYLCAKRPSPAPEQECLRCPHYVRPQPAVAPAATCISWANLWHAQEGKTALVLACGPSVQLPGELPTPHAVDPRTVSADVVIGTNWAWKWYGDLITYMLAYDVTPCLGWRPAHLKLVTATRGREAPLLARCQPYCLFPSCDYGEIAKGAALPCSRNSGFAALAFAAYLGCSRILVLGMDFGARDGRMHFYHESESAVAVRVRSFGSQKARVQGDLTKLLTAVRATGATVENLSPGSVLDWGQP